MPDYGLKPDEEHAIRRYIKALCTGKLPERAPILSDERWTTALRSTAATYRNTNGDLRQLEQRMTVAVDRSPIMPLLLKLYREIASPFLEGGAVQSQPGAPVMQPIASPMVGSLGEPIAEAGEQPKTISLEEEQAYHYIRMLLNRSLLNKEQPIEPRPKLGEPWDRRLQQMEVTFLATRGDQEKVRRTLFELRRAFEPLRRLFPEPQGYTPGHKSWIALEAQEGKHLTLVPDEMIFPFDLVEHDPALPPTLQKIVKEQARAREIAGQFPTQHIQEEVQHPMQDDPALDEEGDESLTDNEPDYDAMKEIENELSGWGGLADDEAEQVLDQRQQEGEQASQAGSLVETITHTGDYLEAEPEPLPEKVRFPAAFTRDACPTLDLYEEFSRKASPEADDDFHAFCGLFLLSTIMARRVYLPMQRKRVYSNLLIALCARTSLFAKTTTVEVAIEVLEEAGLSFLLGPDRSTPQKMLSDMSGNIVPANFQYLEVAEQEYIRHELAFSGQRGFFYDEFGKFAEDLKGKNSPNKEFVSIMLSLDGCPRKYEVRTNARNTEIIKNPYMALIGCMTPPNISEIAQAGAAFWRDGFWARVSFIAAPTDSFKDAPFGIGELPIPAELIAKLRAWHARLGIPSCQIEALTDEKGKPNGDYRVASRSPLPQTACAMSQEAYQAWIRYRRALKYLLARLPHKDFDGSYARLPTTALRIAVIIASLENGNSIELKHWARAQELAEVLRANLHELYAQVNAEAPSLAARVENEVYAKVKELSAKGRAPITAARLKCDYLKNHEVNDLQLVLERLVKNGLLSKQSTAKNTGKYDLAIEE